MIETDVIDDRHVPFSAAFNARDLGGLPTTDGHTIRRGQIFRADGIHRLPEDDVDRLRALGIRTVIDLRTTGELQVAGQLRADGVSVVHLPIIRETWDPERIVVSDDPVEFLVERYLEMLDEGGPAISATFELLASSDRRPLVFHCSAGKDRTGVVAALLLSVLGVHDDVVADDYASSAAAMTKLVQWIATNRPEAIDAMNRQPKAMLECPGAAMHQLLDEVRARYGSVEDYLIGSGVSPGALDAVWIALRERVGTR
jgi:protein tyrosine/serine phosphatase